MSTTTPRPMPPALHAVPSREPAHVAPLRRYAGPLGLYEGAKAGLVDAGMTPDEYAAACRDAAKRAGV